jgi:hypothetical protein
MPGNFLDPDSMTPFPEAQDASGLSPKDRGEDGPAPLSVSSSDELAQLLAQPTADPFLDPAPLAEPLGSPDLAPGLSTHESSEASRAPDRGDAAFGGGKRESTAGPGVPPLSSVSGPSPEVPLKLGIQFTPLPDQEPCKSRPGKAVQASAASTTVPEREADEPQISWPFLLVSSYASAVTLALGWLLWMGTDLGRSRSPEISEPPVVGQATSEAAPAHAPRRPRTLPPRNLTTIGHSIKLGNLEVIPAEVRRGWVALTRLDGSTGEMRDAEDCLILTLEFVNESSDVPLKPLEPSFVRESSWSDEACFIETPDGHQVAAFPLALESEWSIQDQSFPNIEPGDRARTIVVSEPLTAPLPEGPLIWRIKVRTGLFQTDVLGVRFRAEDVADQD